MAEQGVLIAEERETGLALAVKREVLAPESGFQTGRISLAKESQQLTATALEIVAVTSQESYKSAIDLGRVLQQAKKNTEEFYKGHKRSIDAVKDEVLRLEKLDAGEIVKASTHLVGITGTWEREQERIRQVKQRMADEEAVRQVREERLERERVAREEQLQRAVEAEQAGNKEEAVQILDEVVIVEEPLPMPVVIQRTTQHVAGKVNRPTYGAKVTDLKALIAAVAAGKVPMQALQANDTFISAQARAFKDGFKGMYPGVDLTTTISSGFRS